MTYQSSSSIASNHSSWDDAIWAYWGNYAPSAAEDVENTLDQIDRQIAEKDAYLETLWPLHEQQLARCSVLWSDEAAANPIRYAMLCGGRSEIDRAISRTEGDIFILEDLKRSYISDWVDAAFFQDMICPYYPVTPEINIPEWVLNAISDITALPVSNEDPVTSEEIVTEKELLEAMIPQEVLDQITNLTQESSNWISELNRCEAINRLAEDFYGSTIIDCSRTLTE